MNTPRMVTVILILVLSAGLLPAQDAAVDAQIMAIDAALDALNGENSAKKLEEGIAEVTQALERLEGSQRDRTTLERTNVLRQYVLYHETRLELMGVKQQLRREQTTNFFYRAGGAVIAGAGLGLMANFIGAAETAYSNYDSAVLTSDAALYRDEAVSSMNRALYSGVGGVLVGSAVFILPPAIMDLKDRIARRKREIRDLESELRELNAVVSGGGQ